VKFQPLIAIFLTLQTASASFSQQPSATPPPMPTQQAPQKPDDQDVVRITTNLVQVDAVVTDKNGKVVTDLKPGEVELFEDGKKRDITHFQYYSNESRTIEVPENVIAPNQPVDKTAPPLPTKRLEPGNVRRTMAMVVDDLNFSFESINHVRQSLKKFVDEEMQPGDLVALIRTRGGMSVMQQFTSDKRQLYAAISQIKWYPAGGGGLGAFDAISVLQQGDAASVGGAKGADDPKENLNAIRRQRFSLVALQTISYVIRGLEELPGRKSVLLVADGLVIADFNDPAGNTDILQQMRILTDQANRAAVVIHTMDARGLQPLGLTAADNTGFIDPRTGHRMTMSQAQIAQQLSIRSHEFSVSHDGLIALADGTGGFAIRNTNNLTGGMKKVIDDQNGYYLIGYRPDETTFDTAGRQKFHDLKLRVTRPGRFEVRMRKGFFGVEDKTEAPVEKTLAQQMANALISPFNASAVHLQLTPMFANDPTIGSFMRAMLHIEAKDLTFTEEPDHQHKCVFDVLAMTFGPGGAPVDQVGKTYAVTLPERLYQQVQREGLVYYVTVPVKRPGAYQLRVSLRDSASQRIGSASEFVEIPDLEKNWLTLSGLTISRGVPDTPQTASAAIQAEPSVTNGEATDQSAEASAALRRFRQGMLMDYLFIIYNARLDKASNLPGLTSQLRLFRDGKEVFAGRVNPVDLAGQTDLKRIVTSGRIQLGSVLTPGEYVAQVVVTDKLADEKHRTTTQWIDFEIVK
jgi:VWFA-related protein